MDMHIELPKNGRRLDSSEFGDVLVPTRFIYAADAGTLEVRMAGNQNEIGLTNFPTNVLVPLCVDKVISWSGAEDLLIFW